VIKALNNIIKLSTCSKLKNLHLQTLNGELQNPLCELPNYRGSVLECLPLLCRLDGIPKNMTLSNGSEIKVTKKK
jgi:hypothetical protein